MRIKILALGILCIFLLSCEKGIENPYSPEPPDPAKTPANVWLYERAANYYIDSTDPSKAEWKIWGKLTNLGDLSAINIEIHSKIYDSSYNTLWNGSYLFINPASDSSRLDGGETCDFVASWKGLDSDLFNKWDSGASCGPGITWTWEDD